MYELVEIHDIVRIPPSKFGLPLNEVAIEELRERYEGHVLTLSTESGTETVIFVTVLEAEVDPEGMILPGDGATYHRVKYKAILFKPFIKEVATGEVVTVTKNGLYVNLGVADGYVHISQISEEKVTYDPARIALLLEGSKRVIEKGDVVRVKIYQSGPMAGKGMRLLLTMRSPGMGKLAWLRKKGGEKA